MTLTFTDSLDHALVVHATEHVAALVARPEVVTAWQRGSSCAGMSVGGLTRHLVSQAVNVVALLPVDAPGGTDTIGLLEHYERAAWMSEDLDGEANTSVRQAADQQAHEGPDTALALLADARDGLAGVLADPPATTYIPWQGWSLHTDDFLVTRLMEMVVHSDDLAASIDVPAPEFGPDVLDPVLRLLTALSVRRHGQDAVVRALARPQRAPTSITAL